MMRAMRELISESYLSDYVVDLLGCAWAELGSTDKLRHPKWSQQSIQSFVNEVNSAVKYVHSSKHNMFTLVH